MISRWLAVVLVGCGTKEPAGWSGEAAPADVGTPLGEPVRAVIGADGGELVSADGVFRLSIPAGALAEDTELSVQPVTNTAWGGLGDGYRVSPAVGLDVPASLSLAYTADDLRGTTADALGVAAQDAEGYWIAFSDGTVADDEVTVTTADLSDPVPLARGLDGVDFARHWRVRLDPAEATVGRGETRELGLVAVAEALSWPFPDGLGVALGEPAPYVDPGPVEWAVSGAAGGSVTGDDAGGAYVAADVVDCGAADEVTATLASGLTPRARLIVDGDCPTPTAEGPGSWVGTTEVVGEGFVYVTQVTWTLQDTVGDEQRFVPVGQVDATVETSGCLWTPLSHAIVEADGQLIVDRSVDPPTYSGHGVTVWDTTISCPSAPVVETVFPAAWFGDFEDVLTTLGAVETVGGVEVIEGSSTAEGGATISWFFEHR